MKSRKSSRGIDVFFCKSHCAKSARNRSFSGPYFPAFGLNKKRYGVRIRALFMQCQLENNDTSKKKESAMYCQRTTFNVVCHSTKDLLNLINLPMKFIKFIKLCL